MMTKQTQDFIEKLKDLKILVNAGDEVAICLVFVISEVVNLLKENVDLKARLAKLEGDMDGNET